MADNRNQSGLESPPSVSALGLRWAALRGMLASPLIDADEQRGLREELLRELQAIEQDFAAVPARTAIEVSAKIDVVKSRLVRDYGYDDESANDILNYVASIFARGDAKK